MQEVFNFLFQYWKPLVGLILVLVSFLLALVRKKPVNSITSVIYELAFKAVCDVEDSNISGRDEKLNCAVQIVKECLHRYYPNLDVNSYTLAISLAIEQFLKAPQATIYKKKKED